MKLDWPKIKKVLIIISNIFLAFGFNFFMIFLVKFTVAIYFMFFSGRTGWAFIGIVLLHIIGCLLSIILMILCMGFLWDLLDRIKLKKGIVDEN
jgi:hypothetical protein